MNELTKKEEELVKLCSKFKKELEAQIFTCDDSNQLKYLGAIYLSMATKIFTATQGFNRTKIALTRYANDLKENT